MNNLRCEIHAHSEYSNIRLLDCINKIPDLVNKAIELGLKGIAITDHETIAGFVKANKLQQELIKQGSDFKIILGNEIYLVNERKLNQPYYHCILLARDKQGVKQLSRLSSISWMQSYHDRGMERVPTLKSELEDIISKDPGHLICTSACLGGELSSAVNAMIVARQLGDEQSATAAYLQIENFIKFMTNLFGEDFYIECAPGQSKDQIRVNLKLKDIAAAYGIKMVIGTDAHYLKREDRYVHKAYLNSKGGDREVDSFYEYAYLQSEEEILDNLRPSIASEYETMCKNSMEIYDKIEIFDLAHHQEIPSVEVKDYPKEERYTEWDDFKDHYPILTQMHYSDDKYERYWVNECCNKLSFLGKYNDTYLSRLEEEADIKKTISEKLGTNMFKYPITLQHYIDMMWDCGSLVGAGRGSSCSGLNHYLLGITQLDPIQWDLPFWRYLNKDRVELGDIDLDLCPSKKPVIIRKIKEERGQHFREDLDELSKKNLGCVLVATFGTETTKSTILTACRGYRSEEYPDGIDSDTAQYLSSLVPSERGFLWPLKDVINGNADKGRRKVDLFINEIAEYPGLLDIMSGIENLINKRSSHASGVILNDEDPYKHLSYMRTPKGEVITAYDLHDAEYLGAVKYDFLVTEVEDKLAQAIKFLQEYGQIEEDLSLREAYNKYFHPNVIPLDRKDVWENIQNGSILNVFQFDSDVGAQAAKKIKPQTILELADANGLMRLMTNEPGQETPMEKYIRFKNNIQLWYNEMAAAGLTEDEMKTLEPYFLKSYGVPPSQEQLMTMLMDEKICHFTLKDANAARKIVGKKQMEKIPALKQQILDQAASPELGQYVWKAGIGPQMGYSFSIIHALAYSFIGYQTAYIATEWDPIFWNTACLIVNSGSLENDDNEYLEDDDGDIIGVQKKETSTDYAKVAKAIGEIISSGIKVSLIDINKSNYGFEPDLENNQILFGMKALNGVGAPIIEKIIANRPYYSFKDFMRRCPLNKTAMISLIKSGAFDTLAKATAAELNIEPRILIMIQYLSIASEPKQKLNLQNVNGLIERGLFPAELDFEKKIFKFNKFCKRDKVEDYYRISSIMYDFLEREAPELVDIVQISHGDYFIKQTTWDKVYKQKMDKVRTYLQNNQQEMLQAYNQQLFMEMWNKYAQGTISAWEMEALCFYYHEHELIHVNKNKYGLIDFKELPPDPPVDYFFKRNGKQIPIYKLYRIAGTVISKNDTRHSISLLTTSGVINVKFTKEFYAMYGRQISEPQPDGTKKVMEKGWFVRGTKLMVTGMRRDDTFQAKRYANTPGHTLYKITDVVGQNIEITSKRYGQDE